MVKMRIKRHLREKLLSVNQQQIRNSWTIVCHERAVTTLPHSDPPLVMRRTTHDGANTRGARGGNSTEMCYTKTENKKHVCKYNKGRGKGNKHSEKGGESETRKEAPAVDSFISM